MTHYLRLLLLLTCLPVLLLGSTVTFVSGGDPTGLTQWNSVNGPGVPNVTIAPEQAWQPSIGGAQWVSFTNSGVGGVVVQNAGTFGALDPVPTASFFISFALPNAVNAGGLTVWADDTAAVYLVDNPPPPVSLFAANTGATVNHCAPGPISCEPVNGGFVDLSGLSSGTHTLRIDVWQLGGQSFGVLYTGSIESVPEPGTLAFFLAGFGSLGLYRRFRKVPINR